MSKLEVLNPHQAFVLLKNAFAIPKLQYVMRASPAYLCREELSVFDRDLFDYLLRVANVSLEEDVCKQAVFPMSFSGFGCTRAGDIVLPSFIGSMNSVGELEETILSRINIADSNELPEAVESWRGLVVVLRCLMIKDVRRRFSIVRKIGIICCWRQIWCLEPD